MWQYDTKDFATKFFLTTYADGGITESLCSATKAFRHTIKQLLHQYHKVIAMCNNKGEIATSFSMKTAHSQYSMVLM